MPTSSYPSMAALANSFLGSLIRPSPRPYDVALDAIQQDTATIAQGHRERRDALARRRAQQQVELLLQESQRIGVMLSAEQITAVAVDTYLACLAVSRR